MNQATRDQHLIDTAMVRARDKGLVWFTNNIFNWSFDKFVGGQYVDDSMAELAKYKQLMVVGARDSFKSYRLYSEIMNDIFIGLEDLDGNYYSYTADLAQEHLGNVRKLIGRNPYFKTIVDLKPNSEYIIKYQHPEGTIMDMKARSLKSFKRGRHKPRLYVDDPFKDEAKKIKPLEIYKINEVLKKELTPMLEKGGLFRAIGTTQTSEDFYYDKKFGIDKHLVIKPAINMRTKKVLWPEFHTLKYLMTERTKMGNGIFAQEYLCKPFYKINTRIKERYLLACVDPKLKPIRHYKGKDIVIGGWDLGKIRHPSFATFFRIDSKTRHYWQLSLKWLHNVDYTDQLTIIAGMAKNLNCSLLLYDATRGELDALAERGELPPQFKPFKFNQVNKQAIATVMDQHFTNGTIHLLDDPDQTEQIMAVDADLDCIESTNDKGQIFHGDSFWGNGLALIKRPKILKVSDVYT